VNAVILDNPALQLRINVQDILDILEKTLREKNWKTFEVANLKLVYTPYYVFNYDTLVEKSVEGDTYSQGFSGVMAMNAITGKLEPMLTDIMDKQPVSYEKEISHDLQYEVQKVAITKEEAPKTAALKLAGQFGVGQQSVTTSAFRLVYWPVWRVFVSLPKSVQRMDVEAVNGITMNIEEVPERELTWMEVTEDTLSKLKSPKGWAELSKSAMKGAAGAVKGGGGKEGSKGPGKISGGLKWLFMSKNGHIVLIVVLLLVLLLLLFYKPEAAATTTTA